MRVQSCDPRAPTARRRLLRGARTAACALVLAAAACTGPQSALTPAGRGAERIATLFWWMAAGAVVIYIAVILLGAFALWRPGERRGKSRAAFLIIGGGAVVPTVVLAVLLVYGLSMLPDLLAEPPGDPLRITVVGEQWWWRVRYHARDGSVIELANEIRLPAGEPVEFRLESRDVIHAFWIPPLGGKMDMIPGRVTRLALEPTRTGVFRGACAEYCGTSHALMAFDTIVTDRSEFDAWLERQRRDAEEPLKGESLRGRELFLANGCGACHTIRGIGASGVVGPDLTHVGSRRSLGAGILPNNAGALEQWIARTHAAKPGVRMPPFGMLPPADIRALAIYLEGLK